MVGHTFVQDSERSYSSVIFAIIPNQHSVVLVYEPGKPSPIYWKLPGGRVDPKDHDPEETAVRELEEETGLELSEGDVLSLLCREDKGSFDRYLFVAVTNSGALKKRGDEGEEIALFNITELDDMLDFFPDHRDLLNRSDVKEKLQEALQAFLSR